MEYSNIIFRSTLFPIVEITMDETWIAEANKLMSKFNLAPSVGSTFKIMPPQEGGTPTLQPFYFIEFRRLDDSFRVALMPNRFDIEKRISESSIKRPISDFVKEINEIWDTLSALKIAYSRVALASSFDLMISADERRQFMVTQKVATLPEENLTPGEFFKRIGNIVDYKLEEVEKTSCQCNEIMDISCPNLSQLNQPLNIGLDFNTSQTVGAEVVSNFYKRFIEIASSHIVNVSDEDNLKTILF